MKTINTEDGAEIIVDDGDYEYLRQFKWRLNASGYARRQFMVNYKRFSKMMHREILKARRGQWVDHANHNKRDNRRSNLRKCSIGQNKENSIKPKYKGGKPCTSRFKGVSLNRQHGKWVAGIRKNKKHYHLGYFGTEEAAAKEYDKASNRLFGSFSFNNQQSGIT